MYINIYIFIYIVQSYALQVMSCGEQGCYGVKRFKQFYITFVQHKKLGLSRMKDASNKAQSNSIMVIENLCTVYGDAFGKEVCNMCFSSVQFSSVAQSCPTLCDPMNHSTPGLSVYHQLPEFTETQVHRVSDAI